MSRSTFVLVENLFLVPCAVLFSNQFLHDLDLLWAFHNDIPNPQEPIFVGNRHRS